MYPVVTVAQFTVSDSSFENKLGMAAFTLEALQSNVIVLLGSNTCQDNQKIKGYITAN